MMTRRQEGAATVTTTNNWMNPAASILYFARYSVTWPSLAVKAYPHRIPLARWRCVSEKRVRELAGRTAGRRFAPAVVHFRLNLSGYLRSTTGQECRRGAAPKRAYCARLISDAGLSDPSLFPASRD